MRSVAWVALLATVGCRSTVAFDEPVVDSDDAMQTATATSTGTTGTPTSTATETETGTATGTATETTTGTATGDTGATGTSTDTGDTGATDTGASTCWDTDLGTATGTDLAYGTTAGAPDRLAAGCGNADGPERTFLWTAPVSGRWHASVQGSATDVVVSVRTAACDAVLDCAGADATAAPWALVTASAGEAVVLAVESPGSRAYLLHLVPVPDTEASCTDGLDEDEDGTADCGDTDCDAAPSCALGPGDVDEDGDGATADVDCDDADGGVHPSADETCNDRDDDCDGVVDDGARARFHPDADRDGFGDPSVAVEACAAPEHHVVDDSDCNDADPAVYPGAAERCDAGRVDDDCSGAADADDPGVVDAVAVYDDEDADGFGGALRALLCEVPSGSVTVPGDCDDADPRIHPQGLESCNDRDDNCDGRTDEGLRGRYYHDADGDHIGAIGVGVEACSVPSGFVSVTGDCDDARDDVHPGTVEVCDAEARDEDCNGLANDADPGVQGTSTFYMDADADTWGDAASPVQACAPDIGTVARTGDCDDAAWAVNPDAQERCDALDVDEDCDGASDDDDASTSLAERVPWYADADGDGHGDPNDSALSCDAPAGRVALDDDCDDSNGAVSPSAEEQCNGLDDDCSAGPDDGLPTVSWYFDVDLDGYGDQAQSLDSCATWAPYGYVDRFEPSACDTVPYAWPGHVETCNQVDDDCDGDIDESGDTLWYRDADGDGHGTAANTITTCGAPLGYVASSDDCDDQDARVSPSEVERCDAYGVDEDCNGMANDGDPGIADGTTYYLDADHDGHAGSVSATACIVPSGAQTTWDDCDDASPSVFPGANEACNGIDDDCDTSVDEGVKTAYYRDQDQDTYGLSGGTTVLACAAPSGYVANDLDCNDTNGAIKPSAAEACNLVDDDCDSVVDENVQTPFYRDQDQDTYGNATGTPVYACSAPSGYVASQTDCNDTSASVKPGAAETCNTVDDDCDGGIDEGVRTTFYRDQDSDGYGTSATTVAACTAPSGYRAVSGDCNDASATVYPGRAETCNTIDDDCDGSIDEGVRTTFYRDQDNDGYGTSATTVAACAAPTGYRATSGDCNDSAATVYPGRTETCNSVDDDCDGVIDDNAGTLYYRDADGDLYGNPNVSIRSCSSTAPTGYRANNTDCDDAHATAKPGGLEGSTTSCTDGWDNDCDGMIDYDELSCCAYLPYC